MDEQERRTNAAALWGSAENPVYPLQQRLQFALAALEHLAALVPGWDD